MNIKHLLTGLAIAVLLTAGGARAAQLYPGSTLVVQDRFSDEITGTGPDVVFIPGLTASRATWKATADALEGHYRLHLIQIAGFADETARANGSGAVLEPTAEALDAYLTAAKLTPAIVIGHSLGGTMALYLAEKHPSHFKKVMLVDALPFYAVLMAGPAATAQGIKPMADGIRANANKLALTPQMAAMMATKDSDRAMITAWSNASDTSAGKNAMADDLLLDLRPDLGAITAPVTLVFPDYAAMGRAPGQIRTLYAAQYAPVKSITLVEIENAVHFVMFDQPEKFLSAVKDFLKS